jgi:hypothetical protein
LLSGFKQFNSFVAENRDTVVGAVEAFKNTYNKEWLDKYTTFGTETTKTLKDLLTKIKGLVEGDALIAPDKKKTLVDSLENTILVDKDVADAAGAAPPNGKSILSLYGEFISNVDNTYKREKGRAEAAAANKQANRVVVQYKSGQEGQSSGNDQTSQLIETLSKQLDKAKETLQKAEVEAAKAEAAKAEAEAEAQQAAQAAKDRAAKAVKEAQEAVDQLNRGLAKAIDPSKPSPISGDVSNEFKEIDRRIEAQSKLVSTSLINVQTVFKMRLNPAFSANNYNVFSKLLNTYMEESTNDTTKRDAGDNLAKRLRANNLVPAEVLAITTSDKVVFVFLILFFRLIVSSVVETLIMKGKIKTMTAAVMSYLGIYTFFFIGFCMLINLDMYRLRIIFNYINFHAHAANAFLHLALLWVFGLLIYLIMWNLNFPYGTIKVKAISDREKQDLIMRLTTLTMIVWAVLILVVVFA